MKKIKSIAVLIGLVLLPLFIGGCNEETVTPPTGTTIDTTASEAKSILAYQVCESEMNKMINGNYTKPSDYDQLKFTNALALYDEAITLNPNNKGARFGAALTNLLSAYADAEINKLIKDMDTAFNSKAQKSVVLTDLMKIVPLPGTTSGMKMNTAAAGSGIIFMLTNALKDPPLLSRVQSVLRNNFLPKIQKAIDHLSYIDSSETFKFVITGKMQGDPGLANVALYPTEAALMNAMLHYLKFNIQSMLVYKFDLADYQQSTLLAALAQSNTTFFVLASDGKDQAAGAKSSFSTMITKMRKAIDYLQRISGNKNDAIIKLGNNGIRQADLDTVKVYLNKVETALNSDLTLELKNADSEGRNYTVKINFNNFFTNLPVNPKKDLLPAYTVSAVGTKDVKISFNANTYAEFNFPDPTMGGLFPGMTNETLKRLMFIDESFAFNLEGYVDLQPYFGYQGPIYGGMTVKLYTASSVYTAQTDEWGGYRIMVRDATTTPVPVTKFSIVINGEETELQNVSTSTFSGIAAKQWKWAPIRYILKPSGLTGFKLTSFTGVSLQWTIPVGSFQYYWYDSHIIQRKTGTSAFQDLNNVSPQNNILGAYDYNVTPGQQYTYRVRTKGPSEQSYYYGGDLFLVNKFISYSNEVTVTP